MASTHENKPIGKARQRDRKVEQRSQKPDQRQSPTPDQLQSPNLDQLQEGQNQICATVASTDTSPLGAVASADSVPVSFQNIANAYGDYTKKSFEQAMSFVEKLTGVRSLERAIEIQAEFAKQAYETFVAESQKICELYSELAQQIFKPMGGFVGKATQTAR
jgi:hypothetical protein